MKCEDCGAPNASKVREPYLYNVEDKTVWMWLCRKHYLIRELEI